MVFFDERVSRAWVRSSCIQPFIGKENLNCLTAPVSIFYSSQVFDNVNFGCCRLRKLTPVNKNFNSINVNHKANNEILLIHIIDRF